MRIERSYEMEAKIDLSTLTISELIALSKRLTDEIFTRYNEVNIKTEELCNALKLDEDYNVLFVKGHIVVDTRRKGKLINRDIKVLYKNVWVPINLVTKEGFANSDEFVLKHKIKILTGEIKYEAN